MHLAGWLGGQSTQPKLMCLAVGEGCGCLILLHLSWLKWLFIEVSWLSYNLTLYTLYNCIVSCRLDPLPQADRQPSLSMLHCETMEDQGLQTQTTSLSPHSMGQSQSQFNGEEKWIPPLNEISPKVTLKKGSASKHKQNENATHRLGENTYKWCDKQALNFQNLQTAHED